MTRINLLPWREARREQQRRDFFTLLGGAAVLAALGVVLVHIQINGLIEHQESRNRYLREEIDRLKTVAAQIAEMDKTKSRLLGRLEIIQNLQSSRPHMVQVFDTLPRLLPDPDAIYLTSLSATRNELSLAGMASSNNTVSDLMRNLSASALFNEPTLKVIENKAINQIRVSEFQLAVASKAAAAQEPAETPP